MKTARNPASFVVLLTTVALLVSIGAANAQFGPGSYNPYRPSSGGSYVPGVSNRYTIPISPFGPVGPVSFSVPAGGNYYWGVPYYGAIPALSQFTPIGNNVFVQTPPYWWLGRPYPFNIVYSGTINSSNVSRSGYRTGGTYSSSASFSSSNSSSSPAPEVNNAAGIARVEPAAPAAEQPRNAFNRWANQRDRQAAPAPAHGNNLDELTRNLSQPELKDVISGEALNVVLDALIAMPDKVKTTAPIVFEENTLKRLNFTRGTGSIGLLRFEGRIDWPQALLKLQVIAPNRLEVEMQFAEVYKQAAENGQADIKILDAMLKHVDDISERLATDGKALTFSENVTAKRFLASLEDSIRFLKQPDAGDWLPGKCKLKPVTVQELIQIMAEKRIRFAPALVGDDQVNISTHLMLARVYRQATMNR